MESIIPSAFNSSQFQGSPAGRDAALIKEPVDLNKVLNQALTAAKTTIEDHRIIIRCDELPVVEGNKLDFEKLFNNIMQLVLSQKPVGSKQFLYVKCEEEKLSAEVMNLSNHHNFFVIQFHTNIVLDAYSEAAFLPLVTECEQIAKTYNGSFTCSHLHSGSLFTLRISGKPL